MKTVLMLCYARSGGTLLSRCLGSLPGVVLLSEVSPFRRGEVGIVPVTVRDQARRWYGIPAGSDDFAEAVEQVASHCSASGQRLVVRGWPVGDFVPIKQNGHSPPLRFEEYHLLAGRLDLKPFFFIRDAIDIWISNGCRRDFFRHYRRFVEEIGAHSFPVFRYEEFCSRPKETMRRLCERTGLTYSESFLNFGAFDRVTGDLQKARPSRGLRTGGIRLLPRMHIPARDAKWCNSSSDMVFCNASLGYPTDYYARERGPWPGKIRTELLDLYGRIRGRQ